MGDQTELLLFIGFPKTATTTLQENLLVRLHDEGKINFLGRTQKSTHTRTGRSNFSGTDMAVQFRNALLFGEKLKSSQEVLSDQKLNVLSDEDITLDPLFNYYQFGTYFTTEDYLKTIKDWLKQRNLNIRVVLTVRNQIDLVHSCYLQKVRFLDTPIGLLSFQDYLQHKKEAANAFNLSETFAATRKAKKAEEFLNSPVHILLFEDLKHDRGSYSNYLAKLLGVDPNKVEEGLKEVKRKRSKFQDYYRIQYNQLNNFSNLIDELVVGNRLKHRLNKRWGYNFSLWQKWEKRILTTSKTANLPLPTEADKAFIKDYFKDDNRALADQFDLSEEKMRSYGYF